MPIKFHFRPDNNLIISVHKGIVKDDEFINSYRSLCENYLFKTGMNLLVDLRKADSSYRRFIFHSRVFRIKISGLQ